MSRAELPATLDIKIPETDMKVVATISDEGIILDVFGKHELIATEYKPYDKLGLVKEN